MEEWQLIYVLIISRPQFYLDGMTMRYATFNYWEILVPGNEVYYKASQPKGKCPYGNQLQRHEKMCSLKYFFRFRHSPL